MERNLNLAQQKHNHQKERIEKINKVLINSKAGIEHLCTKLADIKLETGEPNIKVSDETLVEALVQCDQKLEQLYTQVRDDPAYDEAIQKIRGLKKDDEPGRPSSGNVLIAPSVLRQTGYGASAFGKFNPSSNDLLKSPQMDPSNIRVRLQDKEDDDDLSNEENDHELEMDENERQRIKAEAIKRQ